MSGSMSSNVGNKQLYEDGDQRNYKVSEIQGKERYGEGQPNSHKPNDSSEDMPSTLLSHSSATNGPVLTSCISPEDQRSIANRLDRETKHADDTDPKEIENLQYKKDPTLPARSHGNEPSKGAKIDAEIQAEEEEELRRKGKA
ncbi:MAG: hypothetical protein M1816_005445 [Peltula sp. TS41687]|nr:MAG: hypothetical protein M1816_005445 [Peltula sp. TS41687]